VPDDDGLRLKDSPLPSTASLKVTSTGPTSVLSSATLYDMDTVLYVQVLSCPYSHVSSFAARPFICTETPRAPGRHWCSRSMYC
jgi:hypothetical protein